MQRTFTFTAALLGFCASALAQTPRLESGPPAEFQLQGAEPNTFTIHINAGQFIRAHAVCPESALTATLTRPPAPDPLSSTSSLGGTGGPATVAAVADTSGEYLITLKSSALQPGPHPCTIQLDAIRDATPADRSLAAAHLALAAASKDYPRAAELARTAGDIDLERLVAILQARALISAGKYTDARQLMNQAAPLASDRRSEAAMLYVAGLASLYLEDARSAIENFAAALPLQLQEHQLSESALTVHNLSVARWSLGECRDALSEAQQALAGRRELGDRRGEAYSLLAIAKDHLCLGDSQQALDTYNAVLQLWRALGNEQQEASALNDLGILYVLLGDYAQARACHDQALQIRRRTKDTSGQAESLNNIGQLRHNLRDYAGALASYQEALALQRAAHFTRGEAYALQGIADAMDELGKPADALPNALESARLLKEIGERGGEGDAWQVVARCHLALHHPDQARDAFEHALDLERAVGQQTEQAETLSALAALERTAGRLDRSRVHIDEALRLIEQNRSNVVSPNLRASYAAKKREAYELSVAISMDLAATHTGLESAAFEVSERTHARVLLDALIENHAGIRDDADPALIARQHALEQELNARVDALPRLTPAEKSHADQAIEQLLRQREQLDAELRQTSPRYAALVSPQPPSVPDVQALLPPAGLLLEYLIGSDRSYLWVVGPGRFSTFTLPGRKELDTLVRKLYNSLTARNRRDVHETLAARQQRFGAADAQTARLIALLRATLMPSGALPPSAPNSPVLIVPDELLNYVPFAALLPQRQVVLLPSAGTLQALHSDDKPPLAPLLLIADPVFSSADPRLPAGHHTAPDAPSLPRLRNSRDEVQRIATLARPSESVTALDFNASPAALKRPDLARFGVIHVASHALLNDSHPELSGIALSSFDATGRPQPGFLRLHEIYNLRLRAALVTLSACGTALGQDVAGEGLASLARGFLYAGTSRVLASLWSVDDESTAAFMAHFYADIYRLGMTPAAALHETAAAIRRNPRTASPYYWAAFTLQGNPD